MKRSLVMALLAFAVSFAVNAAEDTYAGKAMLFIPNRIVDTADMFSLDVGFGPTVKLEGWLTRYFSFGGGKGMTAKAIKEYNRQYGAGLENCRWSGSFGSFYTENTELTNTTRDVKSYFEYNPGGIPSTDDNNYDLYEGPRDIFELGGTVGVLIVELDGGLHPYDIADFFSGWVFIDLKGDDYTMEDFQ